MSSEYLDFLQQLQNMYSVYPKRRIIHNSLLERDIKFACRQKGYVLSMFLIILSFHSFSQTIIAGPVIGAVTDSSANLFFLADAYAEGFIKISNEPILLENGKINSDANSDNSLIINFKGADTASKVSLFKMDFLLPDTKYYYLVSYGNDEKTGSFKTFPKNYLPANFSFTLGSCTEQHHNDSIFVEMQKQEPAFFLHLGDWLYPDNFKEDKFYYNESLDHQQELYQKRYAMPNLKKLLETTPMDFVFDDEDGVQDDFSKHSYTELKMSGSVTDINEIPYPDSLRQTTIQGLHTFFPAYQEVDNQAYHSFVYGNTELFFLDTRSTRSPNSEVFRKTKNGKWKYKVPKGHALLDSAQLNWLLAKLQNSKADWKFIVSGVTFNQSYKIVLDMCVRAQKRILPNGMNGSYIAASLATMWFAFPETQTKLLNFCHDNKIKNVVVLSGDAHTAAIDDGKNAGFPELMAGGLAQKNSRLAAIIQNNLHLNLWNRGGQGIGNANFNDAFGKVEVFGKEAVKLSAIDKYGNTICSYHLADGFIPKHYELKPRIKIKRVRALRNLLRVALHQ